MIKWFRRKKKEDEQEQTSEEVILEEASEEETPEEEEASAGPEEFPEEELPEEEVPEEEFTEEEFTEEEPAEWAEAEASPEELESAPPEEFSFEEPERKEGFFSRLKKGLTKTRANFAGGVDLLVAGKKVIDEDMLEELEEMLITADIGVPTTMELIRRIQKRVERKELKDPSALKSHLESEICDLMDIHVEPFDWNRRPLVLMVIGVNGTGKTTTIGKLSAQLKSQGKRILLVAADTFRAAAIEQLEVWSQRAEVPLVKQQPGSDPTAVAFDGIKAAQKRDEDVVLIDTAGRLHTKINLMEELKKMKRVIAGQMEGAPHEVLLVLDATTGQNALTQAKMFNETVGITGLILTKLDGTAKGGIVLAITRELNVPVRFIGVGETIDDLREFDPRQFAEAMFRS